VNHPLWNYPYPPNGQPPRADGPALQVQHRLGATAPPLAAQQATMLRDDPAFANFDKVPAFYTVTVELAGNVGAVNGGSTALRPESFICERVTWACNEAPRDYDAGGGVAISGSPQGRSVVVTWGDEFTRFLGKDPCLLSALFGDSNGFLDLPRGILFQGKQALNVALTRIYNPISADDEEGLVKRFDFNFQGVGLFPRGVNYSGGV